MPFQRLKAFTKRPATGLVMKHRRLSLGQPARAEGDLAKAHTGPLVVAGLLRTVSGIGASARACGEALKQNEIGFEYCDLSAAFGQVDLDPIQIPTCIPDADSGTLILHLNAPETVAALRALNYSRKKKWRVVGYWVWEFERLPSSWIKEAQHLSEVWTPSEFSAQAIRSVVDLPVHVVPHMVTPPPVEQLDRSHYRSQYDDKSVVVGVFADGHSSFDRKNLLGNVDAFLRGVGDDPNCFLVIKTRELRRYEQFHAQLQSRIRGHERIRIIDDPISEQNKWELLSACDIFLSLHRSEGFGLVIAEAMSLAKPVVATAWSGNMEFTGEQSAIGVPFNLVKLEDHANIYSDSTGLLRWAEPDLEFGARSIRQLVDDPTLRNKLGTNARSIIRRKLNGGSYLSALEA